MIVMGKRLGRPLGGRWAAGLAARASACSVAAMSLMGMGCIESKREELEGFCIPAGETHMVGGTWTLDGKATRTGCGDTSLNSSDVTLTLRQVVIRQDGEELLLTDAQAPADGVTTWGVGKSSGGCVELELGENGPEGGLQIDLAGRTSADGSIVGRVLGLGPGSCVLEGSFTAKVECCAGSGLTSEEDSAGADTKSGDAADSAADFDAD